MTAIRVLFLCTANSARSIIAEALLREMGGPAFEPHSAGTHPATVNPYTVRVLTEEGIDASGFRSRSLAEFAGQQFDFAITVCDSAAQECPFFPGARAQLHWSFPDPAAVEGDDAAKLAAFRNTVREMRRRIHDFILQAGAGDRVAGA
jgi:arsenate reductase